MAGKSDAVSERKGLPPLELKQHHTDEMRRSPSPSSSPRDTMRSAAESKSTGAQPNAGTGLWSYAYSIVTWFCRSLGNLVSWGTFFLTKLGIISSRSGVPSIPFSETASTPPPCRGEGRPATCQTASGTLRPLVHREGSTCRAPVGAALPALRSLDRSHHL